MVVNTYENKRIQVLDSIYGYAINGLPMEKTVEELGDEYLERYKEQKLASKKYINYQIAKCTTSGFVTNLGGIITLPIALPANISSVLYIQLRMIATIAYISGLNPKSDEVRTLCYVALTGKSAADLLKIAGINFGTRISKNMIAKISGKTLTKINQKLGMRFITKFGEKGIINLGKAVPVVGGVIGGGFDFVTTRVIAKTAMKMFID